MKPLKVLLSLVMVVAILLASAVPVFAIGFKAEEIYESVFVVYSGNSLGSGFAVGSNCIVTNAHVIGNKRNVIVKTYDGDEYTAFVIGIDNERDIAVLGVEGKEFPFLKIADITGTNTGDDIYAIGAPKSMAYTLTKGVISAKERQVGKYSYIQIDAAINEGNSGGPLLNDAGQVLGMNTLKMSDSEGIGLAIPISDVCTYLRELGLEIDSTGNISGKIDLPQEDETTSPSEGDEKVNDESNQEEENNPLTIIAFVIALLSIAGNIVLAIMLVYQKRKNLILKYDPKERTDFDIDILE